MERDQGDYLEWVVNLLVVIGPLGIIIDGAVGVWQGDPLHPDVFIQLGTLLMGAVSLIALVIYFLMWQFGGHPHVSWAHRLLWGFYLVWVILGVLVLLFTLEILPPAIIFKLLY